MFLSATLLTTYIKLCSGPKIVKDLFGIKQFTTPDYFHAVQYSTKIKK